MQITVPPQFEAHADEYADAYAEGVRLERARIIAILGSDEAKERPAMAQKLALTTDMPADAAAAFMADLPAEIRSHSAFAVPGGAQFCAVDIDPPARH